MENGKGEDGRGMETRKIKGKGERRQGKEKGERGKGTENETKNEMGRKEEEKENVNFHQVGYTGQKQVRNVEFIEQVMVEQIFLHLPEA